MAAELTIGYSPCPNDTFIFYALMHGKVGLEHISFADEILDDVETLNRRALEGRLDVSKLSFHALGHVLDSYVMLTAGAALGRGCGPLLVTTGRGRALNMEDWSIAIPGRYTTAAMLLRLYAPRCGNLRLMRFDEIMEAVCRGRVDAGVIIHESRFTYQDHGLECVQDLGAWWEELTGLPIPLGCIAARRTLGDTVLGEIDRAVRASLQWARAHPEQCRDYIRQHARELDEPILRSHIDLYVNDFSLGVGEEGKAAVAEFFRRGRAAGLFPESDTPVWIGTDSGKNE